MKIGITGKGRVPYHKIVYSKAGDNIEHLFGAYDGQHRFTGIAIRDYTWSSASMTVEEVRNLLGELRGFKKGAPPKRV